MWEAIVSKLLGNFGEKVADIYLEKRKLKHEIQLEKLRGKIEYEKALTQRASESEGRDAEWERLRIQDAGWKDEWVLILLSIPLVLVFIPGLQSYILVGFEHLEKTPDWYQWLILLIFTAIYGIRIWRRKQ